MYTHTIIYGVTFLKLIIVIVTFFKVSDDANIHCLVIII